jgi:hypothetical protein
MEGLVSEPNINDWSSLGLGVPMFVSFCCCVLLVFTSVPIVFASSRLLLLTVLAGLGLLLLDNPCGGGVGGLSF